MGKWFLTDYSATVGWIMMIFSADPHEISLLTKWWNKISPLARLRALRVKQILANFGLFLPKSALVYARGNFFLWGETLATFRDQSAMLGEDLSQKLPLGPPYNPLFGQKRPLGIKRKGSKFFLQFFVKRPIKPLGKISEAQKKIAQIFFLIGATRAWSSLI